MAWYDDQIFVNEGFDTVEMMNLIQVWLPITFKTHTIHPIGEQKLFVELTPQQIALLSDPGKAVLNAKYRLRALDRDTLQQTLDSYSTLDIGFFQGALGAGMKLVLPTGWVSAAIALTVKTLVGYLLNIEKTKKDAAFLSAHLAEGGELTELWHKINIAAGHAYFYRVIQYEVNMGAEIRQFILLSTRYAIKP
ncbi:hypothetical protein ACNFBR_22705 [Pseudomonas sp. NY11955]|uniref:hypothetical protein n=1 Tax=Pseudomonas sp. NY11955 TaxID=3400363 RepID=UPI003A886363